MLSLVLPTQLHVSPKYSSASRLPCNFPSRRHRSSIVVEVKCVCDHCVEDGGCGWKEKRIGDETMKVRTLALPARHKYPKTISSLPHENALRSMASFEFGRSIILLIEDCITFPYDATDTVRGRLGQIRRPGHACNVHEETVPTAKKLRDPREVFFDVFKVSVLGHTYYLLFLVSSYSSSVALRATRDFAQ
ncbi:hypothetical protein BDP27DRAFT_535909 [Rhodocollybia butyracea]|uniref:Uncharacterized protein n=1 Tax=Rhodocollybia butyracea TaxID=206335 RepID=A0A9P5PXT6_9AGAR|nr:hypothetical protein BDP27DRAFT_535909 [Rhodocollybia butyracea]